MKDAGPEERGQDEKCMMPESGIAMQKCAHAVQVNDLQEKLECRYGGKVCCLLSKVWMTRTSIRDRQCFGYASRTEWVDAAANHLEIFRLHNCTDHAAPHS